MTSPTPGTIYWHQGQGEPKPHLRLVLTRPDTLGFVVVATITDSAKKPRFPVLLKHNKHAAIYKDSTVMFEAVALLPGAVVAAAWKAQSKPLRALG